MSAEGTYSILQTEVIEGRTYYVFSGPPGTIPTPAHTLFAKKVRWEEDSLMVHDGTSEYPLFRFYDGPQDEREIIEATYSLDPSKADGDTEARRADFLSSGSVHTATFSFSGSDFRGIRHPEYVRYVTFIRGYGMAFAVNHVDYSGHDYSSYVNLLTVERASLFVESHISGERSSSGPGQEDTYREISYYDAIRGIGLLPSTITNVPKSSWGQVKEEGTQ